MRCPTCGERLAATDERCPVCGVPVTSRLRTPASPPAATLRRCPRCQFVGEGLPYFRRTGHKALLAGAAVMTYGVGGIIYYVFRKDSVVCPSCGFLWDHVAHVGDVAPAGTRPPRVTHVPEDPLPSSGRRRRALGGTFAVIGAIAGVVGMTQLDPDAVTAMGVFGTAGSALYVWGWSSLQARRRALAQSLERRVLQLAHTSGGTLTVTDVATHLDVSIAAAERVLQGMDDGFRVTSEVTDEGIVLFQFPEVQLRRLDSSEGLPDPERPEG